MTLSGDVSGLTTRVVSLEGQILALPTNSDIANFTQLLAGKLNSIESIVSNHTSELAVLMQSFTNLKDTILGIDTTLTSHTGESTGDGVHGH